VTTREPSRARLSTRLRVRYAETDAAGSVHHAEFLTYFEVARVEALRDLGVPVAEFEARGIMMPVVEAHVMLLRRALLDDLLEVAVLLDRVGPASFAFDYEVTRDGLLLATGWTRIAVVERASGRAVQLPAWVRDLLDGIAVG
jgi:acyl-CoA thioester hydrolase